MKVERVLKVTGLLSPFGARLTLDYLPNYDSFFRRRGSIGEVSGPTPDFRIGDLSAKELVPECRDP